VPKEDESCPNTTRERTFRGGALGWELMKDGELPGGDESGAWTWKGSILLSHKALLEEKDRKRTHLF